MKIITILYRRKYFILYLKLIFMIYFFISFIFPAFAVLGGNVGSIETDRIRMKGAVKAKQAGTYTVHEMTTSGGAIIREYVSSSGIVFAVAWQGQFIPDLQQLLGSYFQTYSEAAKAEKAKHTGRRPLNIKQNDFVMQSGGYMRAHFGCAYIPSLVPQGLSVDDIK